MNKFYLMSIILVYLLSPFTSQAKELSIQDLLQLPLEELLQVRITTTSKRLETVHEAPEMVSIITAKEIDTNLRSLIKDVIEIKIWKQQEAVLLRESLGLRGKEVAMVLGYQVQTVYQIWHRWKREGIKRFENRFGPAVEHLWDNLQERWFSHRFFPSLQAFEE